MASVLMISIIQQSSNNILNSLDNSEWSRNGDFAPSRWDSEQDAANIICEAKTQQNPENTLGIMAYAGRR
jgi:carbonic anhydrase